jgi:hypothetical protein
VFTIVLVCHADSGYPQNAIGRRIGQLGDPVRLPDDGPEYRSTLLQYQDPAARQNRFPQQAPLDRNRQGIVVPAQKLLVGDWNRRYLFLASNAPADGVLDRKSVVRHVRKTGDIQAVSRPERNRFSGFDAKSGPPVRQVNGLAILQSNDALHSDAVSQRPFRRKSRHRLDGLNLFFERIPGRLQYFDLLEAGHVKQDPHQLELVVEDSAAGPANAHFRVDELTGGVHAGRDARHQRAQSPPGDGHVEREHPTEEPDLPYDALRLNPLAIFSRREHTFQGRPGGLRQGSLPDHAIARLAYLWREVWNFRHAFHFYKLSRLEGRRILRNVHPYSGRGVLHEHVGRIGPHVGVSPEEIRPGTAVICHDRPQPDGVATRGLPRRKLADLADPGQHRQRRTGVRRLGMGGAQG